MKVVRRLQGACLALAFLSVIGCRDKEDAVPDKPAPGEAGSTVELEALPAPPLLEKLTVVTSPATRTQLSFRPAEKRTYQVSLRQLSSQEREGKSFGLDSVQEFKLVKEIKDNGDDGWTEEVSIKDAEVRPARQTRGGDQVFKGPEEAIARMLQGLRYRVKSDARGQVLEFTLLGPQAGRLQGMKDVLEQLTRESAVTLPAEPVAPGESWDGEEESFVEKRKTKNRVLSRHRTTFIGWAEGVSGCKRCAVLRTVIDYDISGKIVAPGMEGTTEGKGKSDSVALLDVETGTLVQSSIAAASRQRFILTGKRADMAFTERMEATIEQKLLQGEK